MFNILIFPSWFPSKENPLDAIFTKKHVDLISRKNKVAVAFAVESNLLNGIYEIKSEENGNYPIYTCYYRTSRCNLYLYKKIVNFYRKLNAYVKAFKCAMKHLKHVDFIHIHVIGFEAIIPLFYKIFKKIPYYITEHSTIYLRCNSVWSFENMFKRFIVKESLGISAVSNALRDGMRKLRIDHRFFFVIPNIVDELKFQYKQKQKGEIFRFLHISRLDEKAKNTIGILRVFDKIFEQNKNIELHIVGGFPNVISESELYSKKLKSKSNIFFHGVKFNDDIIAYYQKVDVFVMFSNYETQGVVVMEALFCGLPVITTNLLCFKEYLHQGNSIMIDPKDEISLQKVMELVIKQEVEFWTPENIVIDIKEKFASQKIENSFMEFYKIGLSKC
ncbi:glycosyltransferase family 4 protein [Pedobacter puniceum]|uniref:glycosyltransferase family 4 protein n=1 Tax=Pedobacter puniceum TaxID=2666136 RepID=UPI0018A1E1BB|nr:glycosyltransferase family 4 protein [Pedobacter puniceum]